MPHFILIIHSHHIINSDEQLTHVSLIQRQQNTMWRSRSFQFLTFKEGEEPVTSLVEYASQGGGNIKMRVKGIRRKISTSDTITEIVIEDLEFEFEPENLKAIKDIFKEMLKW